MSTMTAEVAAVTVTTLDGETRTADTCPDGSWSCPFCSGANFPAGHEHHRDYGWAGPCMNPACIVGGAMTEQGTARIRETEARRRQHEENHARWQRAQDEQRIMAQLEREAAEAKRQRAHEQRGITRTMGEQLGFAWHCMTGDHDVNGCDRAEYAAHMKAHGAKTLTPTVKPIRLRKKPAAAKMPALEVNPFKWAAWTQGHTTPGTCSCGHTTGAHHCHHGTDMATGAGTETWACESCACRTDASAFTRPVTQTAGRRGQYLGNAPAPHSVWVLPFEPAPWETDRAEPVQLYVGKPGRYFTDAYSAKYDRR